MYLYIHGLGFLFLRLRASESRRHTKYLLVLFGYSFINAYLFIYFDIFYDYIKGDVKIFIYTRLRVSIFLRLGASEIG